MKDFLGREINIGDRVVYPSRQSSSLWMNVGVVVGFGTMERGWEHKTTFETLKVKRECERSIYEPTYRTEKYMKVVTINCIDRVVVVDSVTDAKV